jgi:hypothetical protein
VLDETVGFLLVAGHDVLEGVLVQEALLALFRGERLGELATEVVLILEQFEADGAGLAFLDLARVAGEEGRRRADEFAVHEREVEGEVMAFQRKPQVPLASGVPKMDTK